MDSCRYIRSLTARPLYSATCGLPASPGLSPYLQSLFLPASILPELAGKPEADDVKHSGGVFFGLLTLNIDTILEYLQLRQSQDSCAERVRPVSVMQAQPHPADEGGVL